MSDMTMGQLLIDEALPEDMRDPNRVLDKKGIQQLMDGLARKHPEKFADVAKSLSDIGRITAYHSGGFSFGLKSLRQTQAARTARAKLQQELSNVYANQQLNNQQQDDAVLGVISKYQANLPSDVYKEALQQNNPLALQAASGARGNTTNVNSLIGADLLYEDHTGKPVPLPILRNYSMGMSPAEHFAGAFGARKGVLDLKRATADAGFFCLCENTEVRMADFSVKRIKDINVGEWVLGADRQGMTFPVCVTAVFNNGNRELYDFVFRYGKSRTRTVTIRATKEHKALARYRRIYNPRQAPKQHIRHVDTYALGDMLKKPARQHSLIAPQSFVNADSTVVDKLKAAMPWLYDNSKPGAFGFHFLRSTPAGTGNTYDLEVNHPDHLFVLASGAIVSNSKQVSQAAHRLLVTALDDDNPYDEAQPRGLEADTTDPDNDGALLAHSVGGYPRNTVLTPKIMKELNAAGHNKILVRSPTVGGPQDGGVYARDAGFRDKGALSPVGDYVGLTAAQAIGEPVTQSQISSKHCLAGDTVVRMADFSVKQIRDIVIGDYVLGADASGNTFPVHVVNTFDNGLRQCISTCFKEQHSDDSHIYLDSTPEHKLLATYVATDGTADNELQVLPVGIQSHKSINAVTVRQDNCKVTGIKLLLRYQVTVIGPQHTYDIQVDHPDHLFVLANGLIVSNSGGVAGASAGAIGGFATINAMVQAPKIFPGGAVHSQVDGRVDSIQDAPQGGQYVTIGGKQHYIHRDNPATIKLGDQVEAGDVLTDGVPNPAEIVRHKGVGEGRKYFVDTFRTVLKNSQVTGHRRNIELLARGLLNHVRLTDEVGDWGPDDVIPYQLLESQWAPRPGYTVAPAKSVVGHYLEKPVLHYTVGTKIRPSMLPQLERYGVKNIYAHKEAPPFEPEMIRAMMSAATDPDWQTKMLGSYQSSSVLEAARRGAVSDNVGTSYVPAMAGGENFGKSGPTKGWNPADIGRQPVDLKQPYKVTSLLD